MLHAVYRLFFVSSYGGSRWSTTVYGIGLLRLTTVVTLDTSVIIITVRFYILTDCRIRMDALPAANSFRWQGPIRDGLDLV